MKYYRQLKVFIEMNIKFKLRIIASKFIKIFIGPYIYTFIARTNQGVFAVDPDDFGVGRRLLTKGSFSEDELATLKKYINIKSNLLVVGAHIGTIVIPIAKQCQSVIAIEANPETYELLKLNIQLNNINNVTTHNIAASDSRQNIEFLFNKTNSGGSKRTPKIKDWRYYYDKPQTILIKGDRLDDYLEENIFDVILMDIEGSEYYALKGMQKILKNSNILFIEFLPHHLKYVSNVKLEEFVELIKPHFDKLLIPPQNIKVKKPMFLDTLKKLYDEDIGKDSIIFLKE